MSYLYDIKRVRVAFSVSPENVFHLGHLKALAYGKKLSEKLGVEFHIRIDDVYAKNCFTWEDYPKMKIDKINQHTSLPGRCLMDMIRPSHMTVEYINYIKNIISKFTKYDKIYTISSVGYEIRNWLGGWVSFLPIYFTEDVAWKETHIVRGKEWSDDKEHGMWVAMQKDILDKYNSSYTINLFENLLSEDGEKISKSNPNHYKYMWNETKEKVWYNYWEKFLREGDINDT